MTTQGQSPASHAGDPFSMDRRPSARTQTGRARIALAHDWLVALRGGERVLERIAQIVIDDHTPGSLYTMFDARAPIAPGIDQFTKARSSLDGLPGARGPLRRWLLPMYPRAVRSLRARLQKDHEHEPIELLISTSSAAIKALPAPQGVPHLCYCHTPARYLWSQQDQYVAGAGLKARLRRTGFNAFGSGLRDWDRNTVRHVDTFLANSEHTKALIEEVYQRDARVVHPPVRTEFFTPSGEERQDNWLIVSALEPYKRVDLAIDAAIMGNAKLIVAGAGSHEGALKAHAKRVSRQVTKARGVAGQVEFLGRVHDDQLLGLFRRARCLIHPQVEDFGITALEAQACGLPVVARRAGGAMETVLEGRTGSFFDNPSPTELIEAVDRCPEDVEENCRAHAERFSEAEFDRKMREEIARALR